MVNCILLGLLVAAIGAAYVWLGIRKSQRAEQIRQVERETLEIEREIREIEGRIAMRLSSGQLRALVERYQPDLIPIPPGSRRLVVLPEPPVRGEDTPPSPSLTLVK